MPAVFVISAPSGAGKTTLKDLVLPDFPGMRYSVSATTRKPREGEKHGEHYFFYSREQFETMIDNGDLIEFNEVHGNYYGTPKSFIQKTLDAGHDILLDLDVFGKNNFDVAFPDAVGILLLPPDQEILEQRLRQRGTDDEATIRLRLENAKKETEYALNHGKFDHVIVNNDLQTATGEFRKILQQHCGQ